MYYKAGAQNKEDKGKKVKGNEPSFKKIKISHQ